MSIDGRDNFIGEFKMKAYGMEETIRAYRGEYANGGTAVGLMALTKEGYEEPYATLSTWVEFVSPKLSPGTFVVKTWGENEPIINSCRESGLFDTRSNVRVEVGYGIGLIWSLK